MALFGDSDLSNFLSKSWEELEAFEFNDRLLFPFVIRRKRKNGWEEIPVALRVPREPEVRKARMTARAWAAKEKLDPALDADLFDNMDTIALLSVCIRNISEPHEPWEPEYDKLEERYDRVSLDAAWAYLEGLRAAVDPRPGVFDESTFLGVLGAIAKARNLVPLAVFDGRGQNAFLLTMAFRLQSSLESK